MGLGEHGPIQLDRFTDPISPKPALRLHRLLHLRTSSGDIQAERGKSWWLHRLGNNGETSLMNSVISNQEGWRATTDFILVCVRACTSLVYLKRPIEDTP